jgi:hypothetical protein
MIMTTYYVATLVNYVLVDTANETDARELGRAALAELTGNATPNIRTIRTATSDEIELSRWHHEMLAREVALKIR